MLVPKDSQLRSIPEHLDPNQGFFIDGIRVSLEMLDAAHLRLQHLLLTVHNSMEAATGLPDGVNTAVLLDVWSLVDSLHRLGDLVYHFPHLDAQAQPQFKAESC